MSFVGEATGVFGLLGKGLEWLRERGDPAYAQAKRLIETFEAYGIARQQIPRILPAELKLPNAAFSRPDKLKDKVTPELLDWAAAYLVVSRSWLDGVNDAIPHLVVDHYKAPVGYRDWLANRLEVAPAVARYLSVWKSQGEVIWPSGEGPLCLVYEETSDGLDGAELTRYWLLSDEWTLVHATCIENLLAVIAVARSLKIWVLGYDAPMNMLQQLEAGKKLIPEVITQLRGKWHPEDLVAPLPGQDTAWRRALCEGAQDYLARDGVVITSLSLKPSDVERVPPPQE